MASAKRLRRSICDAIVSAGTEKSGSNKNAFGEIDYQLDKIFASWFEESNDNFASDYEENDDNVTPLMMACDKCCSGALSYLQNQIRVSTGQKEKSQKALPLKHFVEAWGHPTEASSCGNTAAHHALAVGFSLGLDKLEDLWGRFDEDGFHNGDPLDRYISLLSRTNRNGDTPLMMACVSGHHSIIEHILEHSLQLGLGTNKNPDNFDASVEKIRQSLTENIFSMRNDEDCTALNLACGHGHLDIVRFFLQPQHVQVCWNNNSFVTKILYGDKGKIKNINAHDTIICDLTQLVNATYPDVVFCKKTIENLAAGLEFMKKQKRQDKVEEFDEQHKQARECLIVLQCDLERITAIRANELLVLDVDEKAVKGESTSTPGSSNVGPKSKGKSKKKKKQKRNNKKQRQVQAQTLPDNVGDKIRATEVECDDNTATENRTSQVIWDTIDQPEKQLDDNLPSSPFITLADGSIISKSRKSEHSSSIQPGHSSLEDISHKPATVSGVASPKPLQSILESTASSIISSSSVADSDMAAVMESLCLDPSMLLMSSHGMAMEMSPCQLDAIESILNHQLNATKEAKKIQSRLLDKNAS